jgi:uncharacterized membrane protein
VTQLAARARRLRHSNEWIFGTMLFSACLSLLASFVLSIDAVRLAEDPNVDLSCDINTIISCGTVGSTWQAELFGFPNAFLGLVAEPVVITIAVASLVLQRHLVPRTAWRGYEDGHRVIIDGL